jgi:transcriptional regulator of arginine metabolism
VKRQRQQALLDLIRDERLASQDEIRDRLATLGHPATQSTISRDLEDLGLVRARDEEGARYVVAGDEDPHPRIPVAALLKEFCLSVNGSGNIVVLKTMPGTANAVASGLDQAEMVGVLGTVAGDDTILVVLAQGVRAAPMATTIRTMAGLP